MVSLDNLLHPWIAPDEGAIAPVKERGPRGFFNEGVPAMEGYEPPTRYTSFLGTREIGLDVESYDPDLTTKGPGARRKEGFLTGLGIGPRSNVIYYPVRHRARNIDFADKLWDQVRSEASEYDGEVIGANLQYDLDWLGARHGIVFHRARIRDVQIAEPLLDENKLSYKLDVLAKQYLEEGKYSGDLAAIYGAKYIENMHKVDAGHAARYCVRDIELSMDIYAIQKQLLEQDKLWDLFEIESRLIPLLLRMRNNGVRVDVGRTEIALAELDTQKRECAAKIEHLAGMPVDIWSSDSIAHAFKALDVPFPFTAAGKPSFTKEWLKACNAPIAQLINEQRGFDKIGGTFLQSYILDSNIDGRIFCQFNQLKSDEGGTVSGRFSSSYPNLQNIPARHPTLGPLCRSLFIPEDDHLWGCTDWSQIEFRFLVHYAVSTFFDPLKHDEDAIKSAYDAAEAYRNDASTDFHKIAAAISGVDRKAAKNINFGVVYGMGVPKMAASLGKSIEEAEPVLNEFHQRMPFLRKLYDLTSKAAEHRGYIRTILGRRRRFDVMEAVAFKGRTPSKFWGKEDECERWLKEKEAEGFSINTRLRRAFTHKALNALLQGSAADLMKKSMVNMWDAGIFEVILPHLTVHDELDVSVPRTQEGTDAFEELKHIMATAIPLKVPVFASADTGSDWNDAKGD